MKRLASVVDVVNNLADEIIRYRLPQVSTPIEEDDIANKAYADIAGIKKIFFTERNENSWHFYNLNFADEADSANPRFATKLLSQIKIKKITFDVAEGNATFTHNLNLYKNNSNIKTVGGIGVGKFVSTDEITLEADSFIQWNLQYTSIDSLILGYIEVEYAN